MKILLVGPAWVGDMVIAHALVRTLIAADSTVQIDILAPAATQPLCARMPGVARSMVLDVAPGELGWRGRRRVGGELAYAKYTQAIVLPNSLKSALVPFFAAIPRRTGWRGEWRYGLINDLRILDPTRYPRMIDRFVALGGEPGAVMDCDAVLPQLVADAARASALVSTLGLRTDGGVLALCPGAEFGPAKRWPTAHYAVVAAEHVRRGGSVWLFGARGDAAACAEIHAALPADAAKRVFVLAGRTTLPDALDLLSLAAQVITNDSGLMHVACALGLPVVAIFGSSSPAFTPPLAAAAVVLREELPCSPCFQRTCPLGHMHCLNRLSPQRVLAQVIH